MKEQTASIDPSAVEPPGQANRRRHSRYACDGRAEVFLPHGGMLLRGRILNLSLSGCFVEAASITLERGTRVEVHFTTRQLQFRVVGNVAAAHPRRGAGIAFHDLSPRTTRQINDLILELKEISEPNY